MKMRCIIQYIPNGITMISMCLGLTALRLSYVRDDIYYSMALLLIASILDGVDGKIARKLKVESPVGGQLDSLADFLNFCITPALIAFEWHLKEFYFFGWAATLIFLVAGAYRLARFNVMYSEGVENISSNYFIGVPTPAGAVLLFLPIILELQGYIETTPHIYAALYMAFISFMMISHIKTPSNRLLYITKKAAPIATIIIAVIAAGFVYAPLDTYIFGVIIYIIISVFLFLKDDLYQRNK